MIGGLGLPGHIAELLVDAQRGMAQGALDVESEDLEKLRGRPPAPFKESVARILDAAGSQD